MVSTCSTVFQSLGKHEHRKNIAVNAQVDYLYAEGCQPRGGRKKGREFTVQEATKFRRAARLQ